MSDTEEQLGTAQVVGGVDADNLKDIRHLGFIEGSLTADFTGLPKFQLNFNQIPTETILQTIVNGDQKMLKTDYMELRDNQVIYYFAHLMIREYYTSHEHGQQFQKFPDIKKIVETWYNEQLEIIGGDGSIEQKRLVMLWNYKAVLDNIMEGVHQANADREEISAVLNYYNPEGSTIHVFRPTNKTVYPTQKSHVNYVIADFHKSSSLMTRPRPSSISFWPWRIISTIAGEDMIYSVSSIACFCAVSFLRYLTAFFISPSSSAMILSSWNNSAFSCNAVITYIICLRCKVKAIFPNKQIKTR